MSIKGMREFEIRLENVRMFAYHGVFEHEKSDGNEFTVDLCVKYNSPSQETLTEDSLYNTISYGDLWDIIKEEMSVTRNLLETVTASIAERIKSTYPDITYVECKITKILPPLPAFSGNSSVIYRIK